MKKYLTIFLQLVVLLIAIVVIAGMIKFPLTEGRAASLDMFSIYSDPFIICIYMASVPFFVTLYQIFKLLGYIRKNQIFSLNSVKTLKTMRYCSIILSISIAIATLYIGMFHHKDDDPTGFIAISILAIFISGIVAAVTIVSERKIHNAINKNQKTT